MMYVYHSLSYIVKAGIVKFIFFLAGGQHPTARVFSSGMNQLLSSRDLGYRLHGFLVDKYDDSLPKGFYLGKLDRFKEIVRSGAVDEVIIALPLRMGKVITEMVERCEYEGIRVRIVPDFFRIIQNRAVLDRLGDIPMIGIRKLKAQGRDLLFRHFDGFTEQRKLLFNFKEVFI